jgi:hypothetical protein
MWVIDVTDEEDYGGHLWQAMNTDKIVRLILVCALCIGSATVIVLAFEHFNH